MSSPFVYEDVFSGNNIYPADVSYSSVVLNRDIVYDWPVESEAGQDNVLPRILEVICNTYKFSQITNVGTILGAVSAGGTQINLNLNAGVPFPTVGSYITFSNVATAPKFYTVTAVNSTIITVKEPFVDGFPSGSALYQFIFIPWTIILPSADETGVGQTTLFVSKSSDAVFSISSRPIDAPNLVVAVYPATVWQVYLTDNSTEGGAWASFQFGAQAQSYNSADLAGFGLTPTGLKLSSAFPVVAFNVTPRYSSGSADRATSFIWTSGTGTFYLPIAGSVGNNWFIHVRNQGVGSLSIVPVATTELINNSRAVVLNPNDSATIVTDGLNNFYTLGLGRSVYSVFDYAVVNLTGQANPFVLAGNNLNRIAYNFTGVLTSDLTIVVPQTIQQYWVANNTTGNFSLFIRTSNPADQGKYIAQTKRAIYYCDGNLIQEADNNGLSLPLSIVQGGTGSSTALGAVTNLGASSIGRGVFFAQNTAEALLALGGGAQIQTGIGISALGQAWGAATTLTDALNALGGANSINTYLGAASLDVSIALAIALG